MKKLYFLFLFICVINSAKAAEPLAVFRNNLDSIRDSVDWFNEETVIFDSIENNHISQIDSLHPYGLGYKGAFPENTIGLSLDISVEARALVYHYGEMQLAISILKGDSTIVWDSRYFNNSRLQIWSDRKDVFSIPSNLVTKDNTLLIYFWNKEKNTISFIDDLKISFTERLSHASIPLVSEVFQKDQFKSRSVWLLNVKYSVQIDTMSNSLLLTTSEGDTILNSIKVLFEFRNNYYKDGYNEPLLLENAKAITFQNIEKNILVQLSYQSDSASCNINLSINNYTGSISMDAVIQFRRDIILSRASIILGYGLQVNKVIKENSEFVIPSSNISYWLKQGIVFFKASGTNFITGRNPGLSSIELFPGMQALIMNLDYSQDHPTVYFPLMKKSKNASLDHSSKTYKAGSQIRGEFILKRLDKEQHLISLLKNPNGYLSSIVWTEHADFSDIRTQRAVMFGREEIVNADSAIGGFVGHGIPITKSVFYDNPTKEKNSRRDKRFKTPSISIKRSPEFLDLLKQLKKKEFEICLHTPDPYTTNRKLAEEAMSFMKENFASVNWIDHGYDNSPKSNREDINCDGLDSTSKFYMGDLFKKYGVKYNWSSYYEDNGTFANASFNSFFTNPYSGWGESYAAPEYFRNPKNESLISWRTTYTLDPPDGSLWSYYFDDVRLNDLVQSKGDCILHCYLARVDSTTGFYSYVNGKIVVNPEFDKVLAKLKKYMDENKIWVTTVEKLLDYRLQLENVKIQYLKNNQVVVFNANTNTVKGVSVISNSSSISAGEKNIRLKK
jgi:hypothetical protein